MSKMLLEKKAAGMKNILIVINDEYLAYPFFHVTLPLSIFLSRTFDFSYYIKSQPISPKSLAMQVPCPYSGDTRQIQGNLAGELEIRGNSMHVPEFLSEFYRPRCSLSNTKCHDSEHLTDKFQTSFWISSVDKNVARLLQIKER
jgi:hypothetical protein